MNRWWYGDNKGWYARKQWLKIDGKYYYFDEKGYMAADEWIGSDFVGENGVWKPGAKAEWADAYEAFVQDNLFDDNMALVYLDNDPVPELIRRNVHYLMIYTYVNGKVKYVTGFMDVDIFSYVDHGGLYSTKGDARVEDDQYGHVTGHYTNFLSYSFGTSESVGIGGFTETDTGELVETKYQWNEESVTKSEFENNVAAALAGKYTKTLGWELQGKPEIILGILQGIPR